MIEFRRRSEAEVLAAHARARETQPRVRQPVPHNARVVASIGDDALLRFGTRYYLVPPVSADDGGLLLEYQARIGELAGRESPTRQDYADMRAVIRASVDLMGRLTRPHRYRAKWGRGLLARLAWRFRRNPFRSATAAEVGWLLGFFSTRRTRLRTRSGSQMVEARRN